MSDAHTTYTWRWRITFIHCWLCGQFACVPHDADRWMVCPFCGADVEVEQEKEQAE